MADVETPLSPSPSQEVDVDEKKQLLPGEEQSIMRLNEELEDESTPFKQSEINDPERGEGTSQNNAKAEGSPPCDDTNEESEKSRIFIYMQILHIR